MIDRLSMLLAGMGVSPKELGASEKQDGTDPAVEVIREQHRRAAQAGGTEVLSPEAESLRTILGAAFDRRLRDDEYFPILVLLRKALPEDELARVLVELAPAEFGTIMNDLKNLNAEVLYSCCQCGEVAVGTRPWKQERCEACGRELPAPGPLQPLRGGEIEAYRKLKERLEAHGYKDRP